MKITKNAILSIVVPEKATDRELFAAEELKSHLVSIFGCEIKIVYDNAEISGEKIIIAGPERNTYAKALISEEEFDKSVPGPEGMMIKSFGDSLLIAGSSKNPNECERGTVYAVYEFLERFLGCSFSSYANPEIAGGTELPALEEADLSDVEYIKSEADTKYRTAIVQYADEQGNPVHGLNIAFLNWLVRNRYNRILTWGGVYDAFKANGMLDEAVKRGIRFTVGHHASSKMFLPPYGNEYFKEHYFETHPEYYKLLADGKRFVPEGFYGQWIFCSRNEELIEVISNNIISWINQNPAVDIIAFWPQDGISEQCSCEECSKYTKAANYTYFLNSVAKRVSAVHPDVKIDMLVYVDLWERPEGIDLEPCLIVDEATWHDTGLRKAGRADGKSVIGTFFEDNLLKWHKAGAEVVYYDYFMGVYPARQRYIPMADELQSFSKRYVECGIYGSATQIECFNMWNHIFNFYSFARTAYDNSISMEDNLSRFGRIFGDGAEYVKEIIRLAEGCLDGQASIMEAGQYLMSHIDKEKVYSLYNAALDAAKTPAHRNNIRMMRMAFRYSDLECAESIAEGEVEYSSLRKYKDPTGELYFLQQFDSFKHNDPGYGITIPTDCEKSNNFTPDRWYSFEK